MKDENKSKKELIDELTKLRARVTKLEKMEAKRDRVEKALQESEGKFKNIITSAPMGMHMYKLETDGRLVFTGANPAADKLLGVDNSQYIGKTIEQAFPPLAETEIPDAYRRVASKGTLWSTDQIVYEDEKIAGAYSVTAFQTSPGNMVATFSEITERKRAEERLVNTLALTEATLESTDNGILVIDNKRKVVKSNAMFAELWRIPKKLLDSGDDGKLLGFVLEQLTDPKEFIDKVEELYNNPERESFDILGFKDGRVFERFSRPMFIGGKPSARVWSFRDITERKKAGRIQDAIYKVSEATFLTESLEVLYSSIHHTISELMPAMNFYIALHDADTDFLSFPYFVDEEETAPEPYKAENGLTEYVLRSGQSLLASPEVYEDLVKNGKVKSVGPPSVDWVGVPLKIKDKTVGVLVVQSYTEGIRYSEEDKNMLMFVSTQIAIAIERVHAEDKNSKDLQEKIVLLKEIHHRVKNNLQIICSLLNLQSAKFKDKEDLAMVMESRDRILSMAQVHEALYKSTDLSSVNMKQYASKMIEHLFRSYNVSKRIDLSLNMKDVSLPIDVAIPCGLILNELVTNAIKYAFPNGGEGRIGISHRLKDEKFYELKVQDNGVGIPKKFNIDKTETLGLNIVKLLTEQIDGSIEVITKKGTLFQITFPLPN